MRLIIMFIFGLFVVNLSSQNMTGDWQGMVWQANLPDTFQYQLHLEQNGNAVFGEATSSSMDGLNEATFQVSGQIKKGVLTFQELNN